MPDNNPGPNSMAFWLVIMCIYLRSKVRKLAQTFAKMQQGKSDKHIVWK